MGKEIQLAESCAAAVVECIRAFIDLLRSEVPLAARSQLHDVKLYTRMKENGLLVKVDHVIRNQQEQLGKNKFTENLTAASSREDDERSQLIHKILLPLVNLLTQCYDILDRVPTSAEPKQSPTQSSRSKKSNPPPPVGMLSIQNYTDIACLLEFILLTNVLPFLQSNVLISFEDRIRYHLPKSLAGRINRPSLSWGSLQDNKKLSDSEKYEELVQTASAISNLLLLDRFKPMLLPRHLPDIYAALFQAEQIKCVQKIDEEKIHQLYTKVGLTPASTRTMDASLKAKTYQVLLLKGAKAPGWLRRRVSPLLAQLACTNLAAIIQVFCPVQHTSTASQRLGRALATSPSKEALCQQMFGLLQFIFPSNGEIKAPGMAVLETVWAVLNQWSSETIRVHVIQTWEEGLSGSNGQKKQMMHATIRQIGALCSFVPPSNNALKVLEWIPKSKIFSRLVRLGSIQSVLVCTARDDAKQTLQWISQAIYGIKHNTANANEQSAQALIVAAWVHSLAPSAWDLRGHRYCHADEDSNTATKLPSTTRLDFLKIHQDEDIASDLGAIMEASTRRAEVFFETTNMASSEQSKLLGIHSRMFRLLLRLYLSVSTKVDSLSVESNYQLVSILVLPMLVEKYSPEDLLFGDESDDATGLLMLVKLVLGCVKQKWESESNPPTDSNVSNDLEVDDESLPVLLELAKVTGDIDESESLPSLLPESDLVHGDTMLSIASIVLSLLISVLELGSKLRSTKEEELLQSFLPILHPLAELKTETTPSHSSSSEESQAGLADMSGYAMSLIASRSAQAKDFDSDESEQPALSTMDKAKLIIEKAEKDLDSPEPSLRARGMVKLGRLARGYLGILGQESLEKEESAPLIMELKDEKSEGIAHHDMIAFLIQEILRLAVASLSDNESYVYLAGVQTLVAVGDMHPKEVLPVIAYAVVSGILPSGTHITHSLPSTIQLSLEQRIKLAEALIFAIRRRAVIDEFVPMLMSLMTFGNSHRMSSEDSNTDNKDNIPIQSETQRYFLGMDQKEEDGEHTTQREKWEEQDIRLKTGGPVFKSEESDLVRAVRASALAELVSMSRPCTLVPYCKFLVRLAIDALTLDSSRAVCRSIALLVRELYGRVLFELEEAMDILNNLTNLHTETSVPLAVALVGADEELLFSTLQAHASDIGDSSQRRVNDPATSTRCIEAITLRQQAEESGFLSTARIFLSQGVQKGVPDILEIVRPKEAANSLRIEKLI